MPTFKQSTNAVVCAILVACVWTNAAAQAPEPTGFECNGSVPSNESAHSNRALCYDRIAQVSSTAPHSASIRSDGLLPKDRMVKWKPGLMPFGGIPRRTTIYKTLSPSGHDDSNAIQVALANAPSGQVVLLSPGTFIVNNLILMRHPVTLRGSGAKLTKLIKTNGAKPRTSNVIKGTKGILEPVDPASYRYDAQPVIVVGPSRWNNGPASTLSQVLSADGLQGVNVVSVASTVNLRPGMLVLLDEKSGASWQATPDGFPESAKVWQGDRVAWNMHYPTQPGDDSSASDADGPYDKSPGVPPAAMTWFARSDRPINEIKQIASVTSTTITFTSPLTISYRVSHGAEITPYARNRNIHVVNAGVEDLSIYGGSDGALRFESAAYSWAKSVEITQWLGEGVAINNSLGIELRDSFIHTGSWPEPGGAGYALSLASGSSEILIENNILLDVCKNMVFRSAGAGSVVAYNYADDSFDYDTPTWVEVGINASHMAGPHHVLFEGNLSHNADSDYTHGNSTYLTFFRNHLTGQRERFTDTAGVRTVGLAYGSWWDSFVGNVLGRAGQMSNWSYDDPSMDKGVAAWGSGGKGNVWMIGYDPIRWKMAPDPKTLSTLIRGGNFDYLTNRTVWTNSFPEQSLPASLYLTKRPDFFGDYHWPWVDPTGAIKVHTLPAKARFDAGTPFALPSGAGQ